MKRCFYLLMIGLCLNMTSKAAPGDTTWVQANSVQLPGYGNYDSTITFPAPGTAYRKIYMIFTLGKYMCAGYNPANPGTGAGETGWCGDWDYTVQNYLMTPSGDTFELGRLITPYANALAPRTPWTATQTYVYDVTDYASALQGSATMRLFFSGYSAGFTGNIQFAFIEGTPDRNVIGINRLWNGSFGYGGTTSINANFSSLSETAPSGTVTADLKFTVTGHGSDPSGCCEFAAHNYQVMLNGSSIASYLIWRDNCGENELYPQSGTWLYRRGNWCPGDMVYSNFHVLTGITAGSSYNIALQFDPYTSSGGGSYTTFATLIYYAGLNKTLDASIDGIVAPTNDQNYFRENPTSGQPIIQIHNSGSTSINSVTFQYGVQGYAMQTYTWNGTLAPLADTQISLASLSELDSLSGLSGTYGFTAEIVSVNGVTDNDQTNDTMRSQFTAAPKWPYSFRILMYTSNVASGSSTTLAETSWDILNSDGTVVLQRANCSLNTVYLDTVSLPTGYYQLLIVDSVYDDGSYDGDFYGLNFWGLDDGSGYTPGDLKVEQLTSSATIAMNGYNYTGTYDNDWGQNFSQFFYVYNPYSERVQNVSASSARLDVFPNPAQNLVNVDITGLQQVNGTVQILDALGRVVVQTPCNGANLQINTSGLASGVYSLLFINEGSENKLQSKLLILK